MALYKCIYSYYYYYAEDKNHLSLELEKLQCNLDEVSAEWISQ